MANFDLAIPFVLKHEGGFAELPSGEVVNRGINTDTLAALGYPGTKAELAIIVKNLTVAETEDIYHKFYWTFKLPSIPNALDLVVQQPVGNKILDMTVLSGQITAIKLVQKAAGIKEDGYFGIGTLDTVNGLGSGFVQKLITVWSTSLSAIADHNIATAQAEGNKILTQYWSSVKIGWLARAAWNGQ